MQFVHMPQVFSRRPEVMGEHPDLRPEELLVQLATESEANEALGLMARTLEARLFHDIQPQVVGIRQGASGTISRLQKLQPGLFDRVDWLTVKTTDGMGRLQQPVVSGTLSRPSELSDRPVLVIDGLIDSGFTAQTVIGEIKRQAEAAGVSRIGFLGFVVGVQKYGAQKHAVPELMGAAMRVGKNDWVVGLSDKDHAGPDLGGRFRFNLPGMWHVQTEK